jgi:catechol 2,3-dioxygenase-like lactoylglutathione lyase family enzyme
MEIDHLDHLVLTVQNIEATCEFYARLLGMQVITFGGGRKALQFGSQRINLHEVGKEFEPKASLPMPGSADLCFISRTPIAEVIDQIRHFDVEIEEGPVPRIGARGDMISVYIRDPDKNLIEIANYVDKMDTERSDK